MKQSNVAILLLCILCISLIIFPPYGQDWENAQFRESLKQEIKEELYSDLDTEIEMEAEIEIQSIDLDLATTLVDIHFIEEESSYIQYDAIDHILSVDVEYDGLDYIVSLGDEKNNLRTSCKNEAKFVIKHYFYKELKRL